MSLIILSFSLDTNSSLLQLAQLDSVWDDDDDDDDYHYYWDDRTEELKRHSCSKIVKISI